ncbi:protein of unknown function DUF1058 [Parvibaculum lavamentivorans DS-1]|uniref:SH3b domain-containing protein n=1 Tax=Parvibaculum lavamentivorans (strain DS-1 / DSM 13023 / NCIMB 13966) TaxID=402881 RepID=A7HZA7_PARL1|nr:SH3 domain-containing protein [Parvibaculum lavamentivorans]ABS65240.1 protein of unknown function DUF1058 [Parvibaculum lavamentivorans DS-1]
MPERKRTIGKKTGRGLAAGGALLVALGCLTGMAQASDRIATAALEEREPLVRTPGTATGLPVPRYVSLKSGRANVRRGPGTDFPIDWVYRKSGMPLEVIAESNNWRRIRDHEGDGGWIWHTMLAGERSAIVDAQAADGGPVALYKEPDRQSAVMAYAERGLVARVTSCTGNWCHLEAGGAEGWVAQSALWGVYPGERFE